MLRSSLLSLLAPLLAGVAQDPPAQDPPAPTTPPPEAPAPPRETLLRGATVHTMEEGAEPRVLDVLVVGDRIEAVGAALAADGADVLELEGFHVVPGLIDGLANHDPEHDVLHVASGVTLIRDHGNERERVLVERERAQRDRAPGPDLFVAGLILDGFPPATNQSVVLRDEVTAATLLPRVLEDEPDFLSVNRGLPIAAWRRAIQAAHGAGIELWGFLPREVSFEKALEGGMDGIFGLDGLLPEGAAWTSIEIDALAPRVQAAANARLEITPLLHATAASARAPAEEPAALALLGPHYVAIWRARIAELRAAGPEQEAAMEATLDRQSELLARLFAAGVRLVPGSGAPNALLAPGAGLVDELECWVRAGIPRASVLELATAGAAEALGVADERGTIAPGKLADLVVLGGDPRTSFAPLRAPHAVVVRGRALSRADLDARLDALREAQAERMAQLAAPVDVPLPRLPKGDVVLEARYETHAFGVRTSAEHLAVVREPDGATSYCTRVVSPAIDTPQRTDVELVQRFRDGRLERFELAIRAAGTELTTSGVLVGELLQVERRANGAFLDNQRASGPLELVDIGSALTDVVVAQHWSEGSHRALYFEGINPVECEWRLRIEPADHRFLVATGQGPLIAGFDAHGAPSFSVRRAGNHHTELKRVAVHTFGGPGLALPPERVYVAPSDAPVGEDR